MKNRKLILIVSLVLAMTMSLGGTLAYLQDTDADVNTMVLGNVKIEQHEYERAIDENGNYVTYEETEREGNPTGYKLQDFTQDKPLLPAVGKVTGWEPEPQVYFAQLPDDSTMGAMTILEGLNNVQDKFVFVENTGNTNAYVRTYIAFETGSCDADKWEKLVMSSTHIAWKQNDVGIVNINGNNYYVIEFVYDGNFTHEDGTVENNANGKHPGGVVPAGDFTYCNLAQVYLKPEATNEDLIALDGNKNGTYDIIVLSQAVQADGFSDAVTALNTGFGEATAIYNAEEGQTEGDWNVDVWLENASTTLPKVADSVEALKAQLEAGETDIVVSGVVITESPFNGKGYTDRNIVFYDCTFNSNMNWMYINNATFTNCTFDCGSENAAVHYDELHGDAVFNNCTFKSGKIQIGTNNEGDATVTFNDCVFEATETTSIWAEKGMRFYSPVEFNNCAFNNRVVVAGANELPVTFDSCTMTNDAGKTIDVYYNDNADGIIRGGNVPAVTIK